VDKITIKDIKNSYSTEKKNQDKTDLLVYYIVRPISFYFTWIFLKLKFTATQVTVFSIVLGVLGCLLIAIGGFRGKIFGWILIFSWVILDCVDGNMARFENKSSNFGAFIDAFGGYSMYALVFVSLGIGAFNGQQFNFPVIFDHYPELILIFGFWASMTAIFSRLIYQKFLNLFPEDRSEGITPKDNTGSLLLLLGQNFAGIQSFLQVFMIIAIIFEIIDVFVLAYSLVNTLVLIYSLRNVLTKAQ